MSPEAKKLFRASGNSQWRWLGLVWCRCFSPSPLARVPHPYVCAAGTMSSPLLRPLPSAGEAPVQRVAYDWRHLAPYFLIGAAVAILVCGVWSEVRFMMFLQNGDEQRSGMIWRCT